VGNSGREMPAGVPSRSGRSERELAGSCRQCRGSERDHVRSIDRGASAERQSSTNENPDAEHLERVLTELLSGTPGSPSRQLRAGAAKDPTGSADRDAHSLRAVAPSQGTIGASMFAEKTPRAGAPDRSSERHRS